MLLLCFFQSVFTNLQFWLFNFIRNLAILGLNILELKSFVIPNILKSHFLDIYLQKENRNLIMNKLIHKWALHGKFLTRREEIINFLLILFHLFDILIQSDILLVTRIISKQLENLLSVVIINMKAFFKVNSKFLEPNTIFSIITMRLCLQYF